MSQANNAEDPQAPEEASSSGLENGTSSLSNGTAAEPGVSQSDSENKDPSSNTSHDDMESLPKKRGRPSKRFLQKKYKKYMNRKYVMPALLFDHPQQHLIDLTCLFDTNYILEYFIIQCSHIFWTVNISFFFF